MLRYIENFLFRQFPNQPLWVRVLTYLALLSVFIYLVLIPRFIDGQLVVKDESTGGLVPYRGASIQLQVDGRDYKFTSNESGYFSIPIVSRLPEPVEFQVFHVDKAQWFKVTLTALEAWGARSRTIEISNSAPFVKIASSAGRDDQSALAHLLSRLTIPGIPNAEAGTLVLPDVPPSPPVPAQLGQENAPGQGALSSPQSESARIRDIVIRAISTVTGKQPNQIGDNFPLSGAEGPTYVDRIKIIEEIESQIILKIPDEHWKAIENVAQLVNYIQQRNLLQQRYPNLKGGPSDWPSIQQSVPSDQRPVFK